MARSRAAQTDSPQTAAMYASSTSGPARTIEPSARPSWNGFSGISRPDASMTQAMIRASSGGITWPPVGA